MPLPIARGRVANELQSGATIMTGGELAYLVLVLVGFSAFAVVLFTISGGFRGHAPTGLPEAREPAPLPTGGKLAH